MIQLHVTSRMLATWLLFALLPQLAPDAEQFWTASRRGDVATIKSLLAKGVDVNTKFRYDATALHYAAQRGDAELVKLLLDRGADPKARDTYGETPLTWATWKGSTEVIKLLLEKGASDADKALNVAAWFGHAEVVKAILAHGGLKPEALNAALATATSRDKTPVVNLLRQAGAQPAPKSDFQVDPEALKTYAGLYQSRDGREFSFALKDGQLTGGNIFDDPRVWPSIDKVTFRPTGAEGVTIAFELQEGRVVGFTLKQGGQRVAFQKVADK